MGGERISDGEPVPTLAQVDGCESDGWITMASRLIEDIAELRGKTIEDVVEFGDAIGLRLAGGECAYLEVTDDGMIAIAVPGRISRLYFIGAIDREEIDRIQAEERAGREAVKREYRRKADEAARKNYELYEAQYGGGAGDG